MEEQNFDENLFNLGNAVVELAVKDYRWARWYLWKHRKTASRYKEALATKIECEEFFLGENFNIYTTLDGATILKKLQREPLGVKQHKW